MRTKSQFALYIIVVLAVITVIIGCIYEKQEAKRQTYDVNKIKHDSIIIEEAKTIETETDKGVDTKKAIEPINLGEFKLTAYCSCSKCCGKWAMNRPVDEDGNEIVYGSIGVRLVAGVSIAVDPRVIPYKSEVIINGHTYVAHDTGGAIKGNRIDVYFDSHQEALNFGVQYADVFLVVD